MGEMSPNSTYHELCLLLGSLEATMAKLGGGVNELELDLLLVLLGHIDNQRLSDVCVCVCVCVHSSLNEQNLSIETSPS